MPKLYLSLTFVFLFGLYPSGERSTEEAVAQIQQSYKANWAFFEEALGNYQNVVAGQNASPKEILEAHLDTRIAYKKLEYLLTFYDEDAAKDFFNGAPLPVIRQIGREIKVLDPEGLQVLDELVAEDSLDYWAIQYKVETLQNHLLDLQSFESQRYLNARSILEAMSFQVVRIMSLGITGFDTPGTLNALPEAQASLASMQADFTKFGPFCDPAAQNDYDLSLRLFATAQTSLNADFEALDRMRLIREVLNPLYGSIRSFQVKMGIETHNQISARQQSVNYTASSPFDPDFLNSYYFTYQPKSSESPPQQQLGKFLFYEPAMSADAKMSCASCHKPNLAFTDGLARSLDNSGQAFVPRNAPTLLNAVYAQRHFYDLRADKLENQLRDVFHSEREFQSDFVELIGRLHESSEYMALFREAYPGLPDDKLISRHTIVSAMTAYVRTLQSFNSPFDQYIRKESQELDPKAIAGFNLFMGKANCGTCHFPPTFSGLVPPDYHENETEVLGVPADKDGASLDPDEGRILNKRYHEQADHYRFSFKTMGVRNVALTGPYMHNGVFETLSEVVDFYNKGGGVGLGLDVPHQTLGSDPLELSKKEQKAIVRFMESLTDTVGTTHYPNRLPAFDPGSELDNLERSLKY